MSIMLYNKEMLAKGLIFTAPALIVLVSFIFRENVPVVKGAFTIFASQLHLHPPRLSLRRRLLRSPRHVHQRRLLRLPLATPQRLSRDLILRVILMSTVNSMESIRTF